jgi:flagellar basal-body rod protein FlgB
MHDLVMPSDGLFISPALQALRLTMDESALRQQAISSNIANVNTPGYQRVDISTGFQQAYSDALTRLSNGESVDDMPDATITTASVQGPARPDGNTVQIEQEMVGLAQNSARYEFAAQMMSQNFHGIKYAISGQE